MAQIMFDDRMADQTGLVAVRTKLRITIHAMADGGHRTGCGIWGSKDISALRVTNPALCARCSGYWERRGVQMKLPQ